jgi:hypothetical protein
MAAVGTGSVLAKSDILKAIDEGYVCSVVASLVFGCGFSRFFGELFCVMPIYRLCAHPSV